MAALALAGAGCGSNDSVNTYPPLPSGNTDGGTDAAGGATARSRSAGATSGTSPTPTTPTNPGLDRVDGGLDASVVGATFSQLYNTIFVVSCSGGDCHNPGSHGGVSFFTENNGYASLQSQVRPGDARGSRLYQLLLNGQMPPPPNPALPATQLALIASWIDAGAPND